MANENQTKTSTQNDTQTCEQNARTAARTSTPRRGRPRTLEVRRKEAHAPIPAALVEQAREAMRDAVRSRRKGRWALPKAAAPALDWDPFLVGAESRGELGSRYSGLYEWETPTVREARRELKEQIVMDRKFLQCARKRTGTEEDLRQAVIEAALEMLPPLSARALRAYLRTGSPTRVAVTIALPMERAQQVLREAVDAVFHAMCDVDLADVREIWALEDSDDYPFGDGPESALPASDDLLYGDGSFEEDDEDDDELDEGLEE